MAPTVIPVGDNATPIWGMSARDRVVRIARASGLAVGDAPGDGPALLVDLAYAFDPLWLRHIAAQPGRAVTIGGRVALAHVERDAALLADIMRHGGPAPAHLATIAIEDGEGLYNEALRKRETPFLLPLDPAHVPAIERASYEGAYKGVTDILTKYLWRDLAFHLTRLAARAGLTPNAVTRVGIALCIAAFVLFLDGWFWTGTPAGFGFMVLDTVDGKLARCTLTSSKLGNALDHGTDLVHPPFWWWAWMEGCAQVGLPLDELWIDETLAVIVGGYVAQRLIEGWYLARYRIDMHTWRPFDSWFRLITARRNPNMVLLVASLAVARPDLGILAVAAWTLVSLAVHMVRMVQAELAHRRTPLVSWLA
jgi:hypothetical protein